MALIKDSVGAKGKNNVEDVKVVQWLLIRLYKDYENKQCEVFWKGTLPKRLIGENGIIDTVTLLAIKEFTNFCNGNITLATLGTVSFLSDGTIYPNDYYNLCLVAFAANPNFSLTVDYNDPRIKQALDGRIDFVQFRHIVETTQRKSLTKFGREMQALLGKPKIRAFLDVIAYAEGTDKIDDGKQTGYDIMYGGTEANPKLMPDLYDHPKSRAAAGRYQAVGATWDEAKPLLGLFDMTQESQDIFAVYAIFKKRKNVLDFLENDDFPNAVDAGSLEWASFPNRTASNGDMENNATSYYEYTSGPRKGQKQPSVKLSILQGIYNTSLSKFKGVK
jgi:muramidase (phage lysozyme)